MSEKHTQGRLQAGVSLYQGVENFTAVSEDNTQKIVALCGIARAKDEPESIANTQRIVACWNACDGIPTEKLEGKSIAEYASEEAYLAGFVPDERGATFGVKGLASQMLAASFAGQFKANKGINCLEVRMSHPELGPFSVTIQRTEGQTPAQKLTALTAQRDELVEALREFSEAWNAGDYERSHNADKAARAAIAKINATKDEA